MSSKKPSSTNSSKDEATDPKRSSSQARISSNGDSSTEPLPINKKRTQLTSGSDKLANSTPSSSPGTTAAPATASAAAINANDSGGDSSDSECVSAGPIDDKLEETLQAKRYKPKKMLKPRALSATIRRIEQLPPINQEDFPEEWGKFYNITQIQINEEPAEFIRPGECVAIKIKLFDNNEEVKVRSAMFQRHVGVNGMLFHAKLAEGEIYILARLVMGDDTLVPVTRTQEDPLYLEPVLQTQDFIKSKTAAYYRPKGYSVYNTVGLFIEKNELVMFFKIMMSSPQESPDAPPTAFRILFQTLNNIDPNEFSITRKIIVAEMPPKNRTMRKAVRKELLTFLREFDQRNVTIQDNLRRFEKLCKEGRDPEQLLIEIYDSFYAITKSINSRQNFNGKTMFHYMCLLGYSNVVKHMLPRFQTSELNLLDMNTRTPLFYAVEIGNEEIVRDLLEAGATFHTKDTRGESVQEIAMRFGYFNIVHLINEFKEKKEKAAAISKYIKQGDTPLHVAARLDDPAKLAAAIAAIKNNANDSTDDVASKTGPIQTKKSEKHRPGGIDAQNDEGATALHIAAACGSLKALLALLEAGANINAKDDAGSTPLHQAVAAQKYECAKALIEAKASLEATDDTLATPLNLAASCNYVDLVKLLIDSGAELDTQNERGFTPLHHTCAFGYIEATKLLLAAGAKVSIVAESDNSTPLHQAVFNGHHELIEPLLASGADVNQGVSKPLHLACFNGHTKCVQILLEHNADPNSIDEERSTPLHKAAYNGHLECMKILVEAGAKISCQDNEGASPLHKAAFSGKTDCVKYLLDMGAQIDAIDSFEGTSLHNAAFQGHTETCALLLEKGADIRKCDDHNATALHLAAVNGRTDAVKLLLEKGAEVDAQDDEGCTPLMHAVPFIQCVQLLLEKGAKVNITDHNGRTALFYSIAKHHEATAKVLIEHGADPFLKDKGGQVPLDLVSPSFKDIIMDAVKEWQNKQKNLSASTEAKFKDAVKVFNEKGPKQGIEVLVLSGAIENTPEDIARFLHKENEILNPEKLGEFITKRENVPILQAFVKRMNFENMEFDQALRQFLQKFRLPGEAQLIERAMEAFAGRYHENNPDFFPDADTAFILAFSLIMLNTDAHNPAIPPAKKMTKPQFIRNNRGIWGGNADPPQELLETLYDSIVMEEIKFREDKDQTNEKTGWLKKQGGRFNSWTPCWFVLKDQCLYYFKQPKDEEPLGLIPLENVVVKFKDSKKEGKKEKSTKFTLLPQVGTGFIKSAKLKKGRIMQGHYHELNIQADTPEKAEEWVRAIRAQVTSNPFYDMISKRSEELASQQRRREQLLGVGAVVDFKEFYDLALLCESAYGTEIEIKKTYGTVMVKIVGATHGIKYFLLRNDDFKKFHIILVGSMWTDSIKKWYNGAESAVDWRSHYKIDQIVESVADHVEAELESKKEYTIQLIGHSLGGISAAFLGQHLLQKSYKITKVVCFATPQFMSESTYSSLKVLSIIRIVDALDPVADSYNFFPNHAHVGRQITLLSKDMFCFESKLDLPEELKTSSTSSTGSEKDKGKKSKKDKDKDKDKDVSSPGLKKSESRSATDAEKQKLANRRPSLDSKLAAHQIDSYLKRLKLKLKGPTQNVEPKDIPQFK